MKTKLPILYIVLLFGVILWFSPKANAQQESQYTQYMYNTMSINPAYAGSRGSLSIMGLYRNQWVGLDGAPETFDFTIHSPVGIQGLGFGLDFNHDKIGPSTTNVIAGTVSYAIQLKENIKLGFGVRGGVSLLDVNPDKLNIYNPNDYDLKLNNFTAPIFGAGLFLYSDNWYVGFSVPSILETKYYDDVQVATASQKAHYYFTAGYVFDVVPDYLKLKPATMVKVAAGTPTSFDLSLNALILDRLTLGSAYRWNAAWSALAGFQITDNIMVGYAYDFNTTELRHYNDGSHEIFLRFELGTKARPKVNPRFF